jgi:hypothetical protein
MVENIKGSVSRANDDRAVFELRVSLLALIVIEKCARLRMHQVQCIIWCQGHAYTYIKILLIYILTIETV